MLLVEHHNCLIESLLTERILGAPSSIDQLISDFDHVVFHVVTPETKTKIMISVSAKCFPDLERYAARESLEKIYGSYVVAPEAGYDFSIEIDLESLPEDQEFRQELIRKISLMRRHLLAAPYTQAFDEYLQLSDQAARYSLDQIPPSISDTEVRVVRYRDNEAFYIKASYDRVTVIFGTAFTDETDRIFGKVFLQEFVDARKRAIQNAPQVIFSNDPPLELQDVQIPAPSHGVKVGYISFVLFPRHLTAQRREEVISHVQTFRNYFHYHIKASKAYIHSRMRRRTADFLQVLRRARPDNEEKERKTASGRTFKMQQS